MDAAEVTPPWHGPAVTDEALILRGPNPKPNLSLSLSLSLSLTLIEGMQSSD